MRAFKTFLFIAPFFSAPVLAAAAALAPVSSLTERALLDVCAVVNVNLLALLGLLGLGGQINVCLCLSGLNVFLQTNIVAKLAVTLVGLNVVTDLLVSLITGKNAKNCEYPDHASPVCKTSDPCDFDCKDGFEKVGKTCVCKSPKYVCNGKCQTKPCPSGHLKRDVMSVLSAECPRGFEVCGVWSNWGTGKDWECVDVTNNLESCGGCVTPLLGQPITGKDCSAIPGVENVSCARGKCVVESCEAGYEVSANGSSCTEL